MPRSPLSRRRSRSVVVRRSARLPMARPRPLVTRYGPVEAHEQAVTGALPTQRSIPRMAYAYDDPPTKVLPAETVAWSSDGGEPTTVIPPAAAPEEEAAPAGVFFNPAGLVAWALAPDDGPPTTELHLDLPAADDFPPQATGAHRAANGASSGAHRAVGAESSGAHRVADAASSGAQRAMGAVSSAAHRVADAASTGAHRAMGAASSGAHRVAGAASSAAHRGADAATSGGHRVAGATSSGSHRVAASSSGGYGVAGGASSGGQRVAGAASSSGGYGVAGGASSSGGHRVADAAFSSGSHRAMDAGRMPVVPGRRPAHQSPAVEMGAPSPGGGVALLEAAPGGAVGLREAGPAPRGAGFGRRLTALVPTRPVRIPGGLRRRPVASLVLGLVVLLGLAALVLVPTRASAPPSQAALVAPGQVSGLALGDDRLPDCAPVVAALTPRQKLAQRLMVGVDGTDPAATARLVHEMQIGGIFVGGTGTALLTDQALRGVQAASRLPLAVAVDDEGGRVQRIEGLDGELPSARTLASTRGTADVQQIARNRGRVLAASGVTMNFAPDVDVSDQPADAVIGDRSFSPDADTVTGYAAAYAQGEHEAGIFTVLKHFPGHGRANGDSHRGRVTTPPLDQLKASDLTPYAGLLRPGGPLADPALTGVMVGHLDVPGLTADLPSSLTPATYKLLRDTYQFDGLTITDDLGAMKAISGELALPDAVQRALAAGADVALWTSGDPVTPVLDNLERALASGALDPKANDVAVARALAAKGVCTRR